MPSAPVSVRAIGRVARKLTRITSEGRLSHRLGAVGLGHATSIRTYTTREELECLLELAANVPDGSFALEIGSYLGASTCFLAAGLLPRCGSLVCIDTWHNETMPDGISDTFAEFKKNLMPVWDRLSILRKRTEDLTPKELPEKVSLVFLDGDHSFTAARRDFRLISEHVSPGGVIAMHDTLYYSGVSKVLGDALASGDWRLEGCRGNLAWIRRAEFLHGDVPST